MGPKVAKVRILEISGLPFGSPRKKCHLDMGLVERHKVYYEGGRWWLPRNSSRGEFCEFEFARGSS
jgi:hypothetical protein